MKNNISIKILDIIKESAGYVDLNTGEAYTVDMSDKINDFIIKDVEDLVSCNDEQELSDMILDKLGSCSVEEYNKWLDIYINIANRLSYTGLADELEKFKQ